MINLSQFTQTNKEIRINILLSNLQKHNIQNNLKIVVY
jgi:hypothetical protein